MESGSCVRALLSSSTDNVGPPERVPAPGIGRDGGEDGKNRDRVIAWWVCGDDLTAEEAGISRPLLLISVVQNRTDWFS